MALDDRLNQLQVLKVGNVEKAIGKISGSQVQIETIHDNRYLELELYQMTIEEKLPKIMENIYFLWNQIVGLENTTHSFFPLKVGNNTSTRVEIKKESSKRKFSLTISNFIEYFIKFDFKIDPDSLKKISFFTYKWNWKYSKQDYILRFKANTISEFVDKTKIFLVNNIKKRGNYYDKKLGARDYGELPHLLNLVPELISKIYKEESNTHKNKLEVTQHQNQSLEDLDVSDFS